VNEIEVLLLMNPAEQAPHSQHIFDSRGKPAWLCEWNLMDGDISMQWFAHVQPFHGDVKSVPAAGKIGEKAMSDQPITVRQVIGQQIGAMRDENV